MPAQRSSMCLIVRCGSPRSVTHGHVFRILGTPTEDTWPGIKQLPDYKDSFPHWSRQDLLEHVAGLDDDGIDLLKDLLIYDTSKRISGKCHLP